MARNEQILVVKRDTLFSKTPAWLGVKTGCLNQIQSLIVQHQEFHARDQMEEDPNYKQIIPYLVFCHNDKYFLMQRSDVASEKRLQNKYTLGIGGHVRKEDLAGATIAEWAEREFHEEVDYQGSVTIEPVGVINDDSDAVGRVHLGLVLLLRGNSDQIKIRSELKSGYLASKSECLALLPAMESWSAHVVTNLFIPSHKR